MRLRFELLAAAAAAAAPVAAQAQGSPSWLAICAPAACTASDGTLEPAGTALQRLRSSTQPAPTIPGTVVIVDDGRRVYVNGTAPEFALRGRNLLLRGGLLAAGGGGLLGPWTTAGRPTAPGLGLLGYNSTLGTVEWWTGAEWAAPASGAAYLPLAGGTMAGPIAMAGNTLTGATIASPTLSGTVSGAGTVPSAVLAATGVSAGNYGGSAAIPSFTVNTEGQITGAGTAAVVAPAGTLTGSALASGVTSSSLTSVGTLAGGAIGAGFGSINGVPIGATTPAAGSFTTLSASGVTTAPVSTSTVIASGQSTSRTLAALAADQPNAKDFGAAGNGTTNDTSAITALLGTGQPGFLPFGTYLTTIAQNAVGGPLIGPGQVETSDGNKRGPFVNQLTAAPAALGTWSSVTTAFNGDLAHVPFAIEQRIGGVATLGEPTATYQITPEASISAEYFYNSSGWNNATSGNAGRTGAFAHYIGGMGGAGAGEGDTGAIFVNFAVSGAKAGATTFLANPAVQSLAGQMVALGAGVYLQGLGDINMTDSGFDVAAVGLSENFNRTISTGALGAVWMGVRLQSTGTANLDAFYSMAGPSTIGADFVPMTGGNAAITMNNSQRIYGNATNTNSTGYSRYTVPGTEWLQYSASLGWTFYLAGTPEFSVNGSGINIPGTVQIGSDAGVTCSGTPTSAFATLNGIIIHC